MKTACLILAAGEGKRMRSGLTKVMHPVCGVPMIYYPTALALERGYRPVVVVTSPRDRQARDFLAGRFGKKVRFATQDPPLGTGHAVIAARESLASHNGKLLIVYGDVPLLDAGDLGALERAGKKAALAFITTRLSDPSGYGRILRDPGGKLLRIVEHKDASAAQRKIPEINAGLYLVDCPAVFDELERVGNENAQGEYYLTDLVESGLARGLRVRAVERGGARALLGINDRRQLAEAGREMNLRLCGKLMDAGASLVEPLTTQVGPFVKIGRDTVIEPGCQLRGEVDIGPGCRIGPGAVISDSVVKKGAEIGAYSVLDRCQVGPGARVGPFARLRPGARLESGAQVGNFVEMKKSVLGKGAKANHLTYLGDTEVGARANIGAGTITCNYDGAEKHRTEIGQAAFIGSDTQLVAPVKVGKDAVVGAGTTVTVDVPDGSLAVSRVKQKNIPGWSKRKKKKRET